MPKNICKILPRRDIMRMTSKVNLIKRKVEDLNITDIRVRLVNNSNNERLKAVASITIDDELAIHDIKIIDGRDGYFLSMPSRKTPEGEFKDIVHPIKTEVREAMKEKILAEFEKVAAQNA